MPGAIPTIWCDMRGMPKSDQRGLVQPFIAIMQLFARWGCSSATACPPGRGRSRDQLYRRCLPDRSSALSHWNIGRAAFAKPFWWCCCFREFRSPLRLIGETGWKPCGCGSIRTTTPVVPRFQIRRPFNRHRQQSHDRTSAQRFRLDRSRQARPPRRSGDQGRAAAQPGQDLLLTAPAVLPFVRRIAEHAYKAGAGLVTPLLRMRKSRWRVIASATMTTSIAPPTGSWGMAKAFSAIQLALRSSAIIRCCCPAKTPPRSPAPARPIRSPTSRRWKNRQFRHELEHHRLSREARRGQRRSSPTCQRMLRWQGLR